VTGSFAWLDGYGYQNDYLYYIYGGWGQGLEIGDTPPSAKYLFARQIMDESTHEMLYLDMLLRKSWVSN
jgi:hypothetical protein